MNTINFPQNPKEGDEHCYIDPIGGASWIYYKFIGYQEGFPVWKYIKKE